MENKKTNEIVVKSNHIVSASYRLTLQEQRIVLYMASKIHKDDEDFKPVRIEISDFAELLGNRIDHTQMQQVTRDLLEKVLTIRKERSLLQIGWVSSAEYFYGQGYAEFCFDPKLKPYLLQLKDCFTKFQLRDVVRLKHLYSIRFYELLKQYETIGWRFFELEELRNIFGIGKGEYKLYGDFKKKVVVPVKKEFDQKYSTGELEFTFDYEEKKACRRVAGLKFEILKPEIHKEVVEIKVEGSGTAQPQSVLEVELRALKLSKKQIVALIKKYAPEVIQRNIELVQKKAANKEIKNIPAFLFDAIEGDFASNQAQDYDPAYSSLISKAKSCWAKNKGGCAAVWSNYKNVKNHECHYCKKFDEQRVIV